MIFKSAASEADLYLINSQGELIIKIKGYEILGLCTKKERDFFAPIFGQSFLEK